MQELLLILTILLGSYFNYIGYFFFPEKTNSFSMKLVQQLVSQGYWETNFF